MQGDGGGNWLTGREGDDVLDGRGGDDVASFAYGGDGVTVHLKDAFGSASDWTRFEPVIKGKQLSATLRIRAGAFVE